MRVRLNMKEPGRYKVICHNDDFTTMDFVVMMLMDVFFKSADEAERLMLTIHRTGQAVVGVYPLDIARSKVDKAMRLARANGFPLTLSYIPE